MNLGHFSKLEYQIDLLISTIRQLEDDKLSLEGEVRQLNKSHEHLMRKNDDISVKVKNIIQQLRGNRDG